MKTRQKIIKQKEKDRKKIAVQIIRLVESHQMSQVEAYKKFGKNPFRTHDKAKSESIDSYASHWYNGVVCREVSNVVLMNILGLNRINVYKKAAELANAVQYIKSETGELMAVPDNKVQLENNKFIDSLIDKEEAKETGNGDGTLSNKITIEITNNNLETAKDVWDDIQD